jgi:hypothetical protein
VQGMSAVKQEGSDGEQQRFEHHAVSKSRYLDNILVCGERVSLSCLWSAFIHDMASTCM